MSDTLPDNRAVEDAQERCPWAMSVWTLAGAKCAQPEVASGGIVSDDLLRVVRRRAALTIDQMAEAVEALVLTGLWHDAKSLRRCKDCSGAVKLKAGENFFHAWWDGNPPSAAVTVPLEFRMWKLRDDLKKDRRLCDAIDERDQGVCRYCGLRVKWTDKKSGAGGTRDHLSPYGGNTYDNVVVACRRCNGRKGHRTPEQWVAEEGVWDEATNPEGGRPLLPEPVPYQSTSGPDLVHDQTGSKRNLVSRAHPTRDGAGQVGTGSGLVRDQVDTGRQAGGPDLDQTYATNGNGAHA